MLVLKRREGQWTEIQLGDDGPTLWVLCRRCEASSVELVFDDAGRHFEVRRPERKTAPHPHKDDREAIGSPGG